jgi:hypothetical protein
MHFKKLKLLGLLEYALVLVLSSAAFGGVVFQETYDHDLSQWDKHGGCYDYSFAIVKDPCSNNNSNRVVRVINQMGEDNRVCTDWAGKPVNMPWGTGYTHRAELVPKSKATRVDYKNSHWVGQRIFLAKDWPQNQPAAYMNISQIIAIFDGMSGTDMKFYINKKQRWTLEVRVSQTGKKNFDLGPIMRGTWTNWTFHYKRSTDSTGVAQVWQNGKKVLDYHGPTTYTDNPNGVWKHGIYAGLADNQAKYIVYFDDVKIALGPNQYDAVQPNKAAAECTDSQIPPSPQNLRVRKIETNK